MPKQQAEIQFEFKIGECNGTMHMQVFENARLIGSHDRFYSDRFILERTITWPSTITFRVSNKDLSQDTKIDENGTIVADKFIHLKKVLVDRIEPDLSFLQSIVLDTGDERIKTTYWGFNGSVDLVFDQADSFVWHLQQKIKDKKTYVVKSFKKW